MTISKNFVTPLALAATLGASVHATRAAAQEAPPPAAPPAADGAVLMQPVQVEATVERNASTEGSGSYTAPATTIGKTTQSLREIPQSVSVITRERLDDQGVTTLPDAMKYVTGITVQRFDGAGFFNTFNARGYAADTFQLDGVNVAVNANMADMDLAIFDRVEVLRGAAGLFQGSGEPGVTINLVRKRALPQFQARGLLSGGSWDSYRAEADVTGPLNRDATLRGRMVAAYDDRDSYLDGVFGKKKLLYGTLEYDLLADTTLSLGGTWQRIDSVIYQGLPAYADGTLLDVPRSTAYIADWNVLDMETADLFAELEHRLGGGGVAKLSLRHVERERLYKGARTTGAVMADGSVRMENVYFPTNLDDDAADAFVNLPVDFAGRTHELTIGADYRSGDNGSPFGTVAYSPASYTANINDYDPHLPEPDLVAAPNGAASLSETDQYGAYLRARLRVLQDLSLLLGGRLSWWEATTSNPATGAVSANYKASHEPTRYAALLYDLSRELSLYASYADIFKPQNALTRDRQQIEPRVGEQVEAGIKGEFMDGRLNTHAALYRIQDKNRAVTDPEDDQFSVAAGKVRSQGFETEISGQLARGWQLTTGYAYARTKYLSGTAAQQGQVYSTFTPKHTYNLWTKYSFAGALDGVEVGGGLRAVSDFYSGVIQAPGFAIWSLQAGYRISPHLSLAANADNLFDTGYYEKVSGTTRQNFYGAPRSFLLSLRAGW